ncbi:MULTISPECIES: signal peptidase II [Actinoplanes]|uniref:signal peptidase II n=1 Tax=Actinoplanes sp. NBRC 101535 TaxID=3032196 RepID=UPI0005F2D2C4|nr:MULTISPECIES: signal peptidase II [Actinoplanes]
MNADDPATADGRPAPRFAPRAVAVLAATAVIAVAVDQWVKHLSTENLVPGEPVRILGGLVHLSLLRNSGAAFSLGSDYTWIFPLITIVVVGWIGWMAVRLRSVPWAVALGLVLGGALGNLGDRLFRAPGFLHGHVVDMISVFGPYGEYFAVFNIADSCLTVGVVLAVLLELTGRQRDGSRLPGKREKQTATTGKEETA